MPISIDRMFEDERILQGRKNWINLLRQAAKDAGCITWSWTKVRNEPRWISFQFPDTMGFGKGRYMDWFFRTYTAKNELFINCYDSLGNGSKRTAERLQKELVKHIPCRVTKFEGCPGVAVDHMAVYELDKG